MTARVNLSADLGEGFGDYRMTEDAALLDLVSSANIACGFHAGDPRIMQAAVEHGARRGVAIGAHAGFPDLVGFGRRALNVTPHELYTDVLYQLGALSAFTKAHGTRVTHFSPHGAMGLLSRTSPDHAAAIVQAIGHFDERVRVVTRAGLLTETAAAEGLPCGYVGFVDRGYDDDGELVSRSLPGAVITDPNEIASRAVVMARDGIVRTVSGKSISVRCDTIHVHGDTAGSIDIAKRVAGSISAAGISIEPLDT